MCQVLLVDDEPRQLRAMSVIIKSLRPQYEIHTAEDGQEALAVIAQSHIDIVMTDIRMPVMDGMELINTLSINNFKGKIVLITGYGDFNYAQQAIRVGVTDYLVKPLGKPELEQLLLKLENVLDYERQENRKLEDIERKLVFSISSYRQQLLFDWLQGNADGAEVRTQFTPGSVMNHGMLILMQVSKEILPLSKDKSTLFINWILQDALEGISLMSGLTTDAEGRFILLLAQSKSDTMYFKTIISKLEEKLSDFQVEHGMKWTAGCVQVYEGNWALGNQIYDHARKAVDSSFVVGEGKVIVYNDLSDIPRIIDVFENETNLSNAIQRSNVEQMNTHINNLLEKVKGLSYPDSVSIKKDCLRLMTNRLKEAHHIASKEELSKLTEDFERKILLCADYRELRHCLKKLTIQIAEIFQRTQLGKNSVIIKKCQGYIQEHCHEDIPLETLAQMYNFNPSYFSTLFKTYTGLSVTDYIINIRMERAQHLLKHSSDKISDIAKKLGYKDVGYFIRVFKREKGISPKKFRSLSGKD
ncbi:response regulator [Paenibacillus oryzisoli]|uniref:response regulator transcription factor n=1 Tax=Paenibacillus oryzisoli TaxID=1850517 RepID=UPI003D294849